MEKAKDGVFFKNSSLLPDYRIFRSRQVRIYEESNGIVGPVSKKSMGKL